MLRDAANAGAEITRAARETFYGGYAAASPTRTATSGIIYNPRFPLAKDGSITIPDFDAP